MCFWYVYEPVMSNCKQAQQANSNVSVNQQTKLCDWVASVMADCMHPQCSNRQTSQHGNETIREGQIDKTFLQCIAMDDLCTF